MSSITYTIPEITDQEFVAVTFTNSEGLVYTREVRIPRDSDNNVDQSLWEEILQGQLAGVEMKSRLGVAVFEDPNENTDSVTE